MAIDAESRPRLRAGCRFSEAAGQEHVLLIPEGVLKLAGPGRKILELCDGQNTLAQIVSTLQSLFPAAPSERIDRETASYLERLRERGVVAL